MNCIASDGKIFTFQTGVSWQCTQRRFVRVYSNYNPRSVSEHYAHVAANHGRCVTHRFVFVFLARFVLFAQSTLFIHQSHEVQQSVLRFLFELKAKTLRTNNVLIVEDLKMIHCNVGDVRPYIATSFAAMLEVVHMQPAMVV